MPRPDNAPPSPSRRIWVKAFVLLLGAGGFLLVGAPAALSQAEYTGVPAPPPPPDTYVDLVYVNPYAGPQSSPVALVRLPAPSPEGGEGGSLSVTTSPLDGSPPVLAQSGRRVVTGWDLVSVAGLGLAAVVGFLVVSRHFRLH